MAGRDVRDRAAHPGSAAYLHAGRNGAGSPDGFAAYGTDSFDAFATSTADGTAGTGSPDGPGADGSEVDAAVSGAATGQGRAARRRQLARWKKHRRRAAAATAVALVGGGLTIAALPTGKPSTGPALASAPPEPGTGATPSGSVPPGAAPIGTPDSAAAPRPGADRPAGTGAHRRGAEAAQPRAETAAKGAAGSTRMAGRPATAAPDQQTAPLPRDDQRTAPSPAPRAPEQSAGEQTPAAPAPGTTSPPPAAEPPGPATPPAGLLPVPPGGAPAQVCVVGLCIG